MTKVLNQSKKTGVLDGPASWPINETIKPISQQAGAELLLY